MFAEEDVKEYMKMKNWVKCYRCEKEFEKLHLVPYLTAQFIDVEICRDCSLEFHKQIYKFTNDFIFTKQIMPNELCKTHEQDKK